MATVYNTKLPPLSRNDVLSTPRLKSSLLLPSTSRAAANFVARALQDMGISVTFTELLF